jgi:hypothetical protein
LAVLPALTPRSVPRRPFPLSDCSSSHTEVD